MMEPKKDFEVGNLVWAKMKSYPFWPARIAKPPTEAKAANLKKAHHWVYFFGSENYAWIQDENILHHSEEVMQSCVKKKISNALRLAIDKMIEESGKETDSPTESPEVPTSSADTKVPTSSADTKVPTSSADTKVAKVPKVKTKSPKIPKKTTKKRSSDEAGNTSSSPQKLPKPSVDYSSLISNTPPNIGYSRVAVIKPLDSPDSSVSSSAINKRKYYELPPSSPLDLHETSTSIVEKNVQPTNKKIGFIGLGMMGQRIVKNLITTGHNVTVWNRTPEKCIEFFKVGATIVKTPSDVVENCDIIFCCVSGPDASKSLVFGNCGILSGLDKFPAGMKSYVEMTTLDPTTSQEISDAITYKGGRYLEAPISGSRQMAEDGSLLILVSGDVNLFNDCHSCFFAMSKNAYFVSHDVGGGSKMKIILSMIMGVSNAALAEAMSLVERCCLRQDSFYEILDLVPLKSSLLMDKGKAMLTENFATDTSLKYQQKDMYMALSLGNKCAQPLMIAAAANELYKHAKVLRYADHDVSAVYLGTKY